MQKYIFWKYEEKLVILKEARGRVVLCVPREGVYEPARSRCGLMVPCWVLSLVLVAVYGIRWS